MTQTPKNNPSIWQRAFYQEEDTPIHKWEGNNKLIMLYELIGLGEEDVEMWVEFENKTKQMFLCCLGEFYDETTSWKNDISFRLPINTDIYDSYEWNIKDGILYVTLNEIINEVPNFELKKDVMNNK